MLSAERRQALCERTLCVRDLRVRRRQGLTQAAQCGPHIWFSQARVTPVEQQLASLKQEHDEIVRSTPTLGVGGSTMRDTVAFYNGFIKSFPALPDFASPVSRVIGEHPDVRLAQLSWMATDDAKATPPLATTGRAVRVLPPQQRPRLPGQLRHHRRRRAGRSLRARDKLAEFGHGALLLHQPVHHIGFALLVARAVGLFRAMLIALHAVDQGDDEVVELRNAVIVGHEYGSLKMVEAQRAGAGKVAPRRFKLMQFDG
jgi:hypothetical protein